MKTNNRLQFRHHNEVFTGSTIEEARLKAVTYVKTDMWYNQDSDYGHSLYSEPTVVRYSVEGDEANPHVIFVIGADTNETNRPENNRFCIIDIDKTEQEIEDLWEELEKAIKGLTIITLNSDTLNLFAEKTEDGTYISGDVKTAPAQVIRGVSRDNKIKVVENEGIYHFVNLEYTSDGKLVFRVNDEINEYSIPSLISGEYVYAGEDAENIILTQNDGNKIKINVGKLIDEWTVLSEDATTTPIVLKREEITEQPCPHGVESWQDVLSADVRIKEEDDNILEKAEGGRKLYVRGGADNIAYYLNGNRSTVKEQLDRIKLSNDSSNIIFESTNGFFASVKLDYETSSNKLVFTTSKVDGESTTKEIQLNSLEFLEDITYDDDREVIIIRYKTAKGEEKTIEIPAKDIIEEWEVYNENHSINLEKVRDITGKDKLSADAKIHTGDNNILVDLNHELYVNGISDNIKYDVTGNTTVKNVLDDLNAENERLDEKIDAEIQRSTEEDGKIETTIGDGFSTDSHETVTYKFNELKEQVNSEAEKLQSEINRSIDKDSELDGRLDAIDAEIGEGFGPRNTVRDEISNLQSEIEAVSGDTSLRISNVINENGSIDVETENDEKGNPTIKNISVNLSSEVEDEKQNIIKLNADGLYAGVDLSYEKTANKLVFKTTNSTKEIQLDSVSSIVSIVYNPTKEAIIITYITNGHETKTVEIPVGDLINEWTVESGHPHAIQLEKIRKPSGATEQDILKASVVITESHDDNILVMDGDALYVSNSGITANATAIQGLEGRMSAAETDINSLEEGLGNESRRIDQEIEDRVNSVNAEKNRAEAAELALSNKIDADVLAEKNRAEAAELALSNKIDADVLAEKNRAETSESELRTNINAVSGNVSGLSVSLSNEISRSTSKDQELDTKIANETHNREIAISTEKDRAIGVENTLSANIVAEANRATSAENSLNTKINTVSGDVSDLSVSLSNEISRSTGKDQELDTKISTEKDRAIGVENTLSANIVTETNRATSAEDSLDAKINTVSGNVTNLDSSLRHLIDDVNSNVNTVSGKVLTAEDEIQTLNTNLTSEITRAKAAELALSNKIDADVLAEKNRALTEESRIETKLDSEIVRSSNKDTELTNSINNEISRANSTENALQTAINNEISRASGEEIGLRNAINDEKTRAISAETALETVTNLLQEKIADEKTRAISTEAGIQSQVDENKLVFGGSSTIVLERTIVSNAPDSVIGHVKLSASDDNIIKTGGDDETGLYASVDLSYDGLTNQLKFTTSNGVEKTITLNAGTIIDGMEYDSVGKNLIIIYTVNGSQQRVVLPVEDLFNDWVVDNDNSKGIKLTKVNGIGSGSSDSLYAEVKISQDEKNILVLRDNHLFVDGSSIGTCEAEIETVSGNLETIRTAVNGVGSQSYTYPSHTGSRYISAATSYDDADRILDDALRNIEDNMSISGSETSTTHTEIKEVGSDKLISVDVRMSHGNNAIGMEDEELSITNVDDKYFSDTNVLRYVNITETRAHQPLDPDNVYNGMYLSNYWDCGKYYQEATEQTEIAEMVSEGFDVYNNNYRTDESSDASGYDYSNNVRQ